ncbi:acyltransferase [Candidatus Pacearchaeota archaeon]|nr:acyltransferase [Candidatus Pacearchaeota archaeon]
MDNKKIGHKRHKYYKEDIIIGENTSIRTDRIDRSGKIIIGSDCVIGKNVTIIRHSHPYFYKKLTPITSDENNSVIQSDPLIIEDHVYISEGSYILPQVSYIPKGCIIGVGSVLTKNPTSPYQVWAGNPAKLIKTLE